MGFFTRLAHSIFAPYDANGVARAINLSHIQQWGTEVEALANATAVSAAVFDTVTNLNASLAYAPNTLAWVMGAGAGIYRKVGASGSGSWARVGDLPYNFAVAVDDGSGTANAVALTSTVPQFDGLVYCFTIFRATTAAPVTVSINGGSPLTLKTNRGSNASGLTAGMDVWFRVRASDNTARMLNDQDVAALVAQAEAARDIAVGAAAGINLPAITFADAGKILTVKPDGTGYLVTGVADAFVASVAGLKALDPTIVTAAYLTAPGRAGQFLWRTGDYAARVTADAAGGMYIKADSVSASSGAWVRQTNGPMCVTWFGATGDGATDDTAAFASAFALGAILGALRLFIPMGTYQLSAKLDCDGVPIWIEGETILTTIIRWTTNTAGFAFIGDSPVSETRDYVSIGKLAFVATQANSGNALFIDCGSNNGISAPSVHLYDVHTYQVSGYWNRGIYLRNAAFATVERLYLRHYGSDTTECFYLDSTTSTTYAGGQINFRDCDINGGGTASLHIYGSYESVYFSGCVIVGGRDCLWIEGAGISVADFGITNCHINAKRHSVNISGAQTIHIVGSDIYSGVGSGDVDGHNLFLTSCTRVRISASKFQTGVPGLNRTGIYATGSSKVIVTGNEFVYLQTGININGAGSSEWIVSNNLFYGLNGDHTVAAVTSDSNLNNARITGNATQYCDAVKTGSGTNITLADNTAW
ncbi:Pectate lyase superfamily protein [Rhizobium sp. RU35A]|uniref:right-handed parallel beta-helix repeat-containing protein n=1 Tax=Rhizobium sp. RU35A TaxID=1907414 RepID=UPI0009548C5F|nr:right-handed parallel beta-helix repeat-containing protein [Rhizobium sp. RU35A]SIQ75217.1 Pectate lyase superfamily protein [Rhizobium sp. RU35A]